MSDSCQSPALSQAAARKCDYGLEHHGLANLRNVYWNLSTEGLCEEIGFRREAMLGAGGTIVAFTGSHTSRSAGDKFIVKEPSTEQSVWWGDYNKPFAADKFDALYERMAKHVQNQDLFVQDCYAGADPSFKLPIRIVTELAWHSHFARNMFLLPESVNEYRNHVPEFTVVCVPSFKADPSRDGTRSETFIVLNFARKLCIIGNTAYAGEIKKSVFTLLNYLLPLKGVMPMHCSANMGAAGDTAIFFGLSGTGKTTLSADTTRRLIGDDEHGWSDDGVFNFEGGCYAKVINLSPTAEPQIYSCTKRFGTILENVPFDPITRLIDLNDCSLTENTRASYPLEFIDNSLPIKRGDHPTNIILLTCDASGVMPPIARLTPSQALYQFISGYTSKIAGTEAGVGKEPQSTFSTCFGAPFMVHRPTVYADLLQKRILDHKANCWLVNTGWIGGRYGVGKRISIRHTRAILSAVLTGELHYVQFGRDPIFDFEVPEVCSDVPSGILDPAVSWNDNAAYLEKYRNLGDRFRENFRKFESECSDEIASGGPKAA